MSAERTRDPLPHDPAAVRAELQRRIHSLLPELGISAAPRQGMVTPLNPTRSDKRPGSFVIWTSGDGIGAWTEYATGEKGDVYDLIAYLRGLQAWVDAYWWAVEFIGWGRGQVRSASQAQADRERAERERKAALARQSGLEDAKARKALTVWLECAEAIVGTPVWTYLTQARGLPMDSLPRRPGALRYAAALEHIDMETGEATEWPAMVSAMSHWANGKVRAAHRTYLAPDGRGKAPVAKAKKMLGVAQGCAVRVWKGEGDLTPEAAARAGHAIPLIITEGIEDAVTAAIARQKDRVWAAGSLSLMGTLGWPDCASAVVLVADNDWDKPQAIEAFNRVEAHWRGMARGRPLKVVRAQAGKDLNDWARGEI